MSSLFAHATEFTGKGVENWTFPKAENMHGLFKEAKSFNRDVSKWTFPKV